jgi:hypothetical protein
MMSLSSVRYTPSFCRPDTRGADRQLCATSGLMRRNKPGCGNPIRFDLPRCQAPGIRYTVAVGEFFSDLLA